MKKETKIKVTAVAAGFAAAMMISTVVLSTTQHPAEWYVAGVCVIAMGIAILVGVTIEP